MPSINDSNSSLDPSLRGRAYWRSLAELAAAPGSGPEADCEFPGYDPAWMRSGVSRRSMLHLMSAALALAGVSLTGCRRWPEQEIRPHGHQPEGTAPGQIAQYASTFELAGVATGVVVRSYDGRPIKVEGNPAHPYSLGAADAWAQASVLNLYDPDRSRSPLYREGGSGEAQPRTAESFASFALSHFGKLRADKGLGLAVLCEASNGSTMQRLRRQFDQLLPLATWHTFEPLHRDHEIEGSRLAFGQDLRSVYDLAQARVIACFDADLLGLHPAHQRHARDWAAGRATADQGRMNRLYAVESNLTITGTVADERLPVQPSEVGEVLAAVAGELGVGPKIAGEHVEFARRLALDLQAAEGAALVAVGPSQPAAVHDLAHRINARLGGVGRTLRYVIEPDAAMNVQSLAQLQAALDGGAIRTLIILGGNPVYDAALKLPARTLSIHLSERYNETSRQCHWHVPRAHELECWGDGCAWDGTVSVRQPLIRPMYGGISPIELMAQLLGIDPGDGLTLVRQTFRPLLGGSDFEGEWSRLLRDGVLPGSAWPAVAASLRPAVAGPKAAASPLEAVFVPDASVLDGRFADTGWLQEMPDPITQITWDNAALLGVGEAQRLDLKSGDVVTLTIGQATLDVAVFVQPGVAAGTVVLPLGYGRTGAGRIGQGVGCDTYRLRPSDQSYIAKVTALQKTGHRYALATTQEHNLINPDPAEARAIAKRLGPEGGSGYILRESTLAEYQRDPHVFEEEHREVPLPLFDPPAKLNDPHAWGMAIDLNKCIGCNACLVGCQAENNVPIVGKQEVMRNREMHWLRVDRYYKGSPDNPQTVAMPMACGHCESAPCEQVCPVAATVHDTEGLNVMVYNRCIGTRYCSNNCPYKVRRFNYFDWHSRNPRRTGDTPPWMGIPDQQQEQQVDPVVRLTFNPDVTVRMRGVMEKCTYCTQRIQQAKALAIVEHAQGARTDERVHDGEAVPACAGACPTQAIVFGDLNDPSSRVAKLHGGTRAYGVLDEELDLKPRTRYLAKLRNPAEEARP